MVAALYEMPVTNTNGSSTRSRVGTSCPAGDRWGTIRLTSNQAERADHTPIAGATSNTPSDPTTVSFSTITSMMASAITWL